MRRRASARRSRSPICSKDVSVIEDSVRRSYFPAVGAGVPKAKRRAAAVPLKREQFVHSPPFALLAKALISLFNHFLRRDAQSIAKVDGIYFEVLAQGANNVGLGVRMLDVDHLIAESKNLQTQDIGVELPGGNLFAVERFVALDLPAVGARLDKIAGVGTVAPGRLADGAEFILRL